MCKISVIMPVYNASEYLDMAIDSLIKQNFKDIEIICVDDGSTDQSLNILLQYQKRDERIKVLKQENQYAGVARNLGMSVAQGKYLAFLDADDYFKADMLQKAYKCAEEEQADIVVFGGEKFRQDIKNTEPFSALLREDLLPEMTRNSFENTVKMDNLLSFTNPAPWNKLFRKDFVEKHQLKFQACKRFNDAYFVVLAVVLAEKIGIVHENLVLYRTGNEKSLQGSNDESPLQFVDVFTDIKNKLIELNLYDQIRTCFRRISLSTCIYTLESLTNAKAFEQLYEEMKNNLFRRFDIIDSQRQDYYNRYAYDQYLYIDSHTPVEYWMERYYKKEKPEVPYLFPFGKIDKGSEIIIYGAGKVGRAFYQQIKRTNYCKIAKWVDKKERIYDGYVITKPEEVDWQEGNQIVIAIERENIAEEIRSFLLGEFQIARERIVWESPVM